MKRKNIIQKYLSFVAAYVLLMFAVKPTFSQRSPDLRLLEGATGTQNSKESRALIRTRVDLCRRCGSLVPPFLQPKHQRRAAECITFNLRSSNDTFQAVINTKDAFMY